MSYITLSPANGREYTSKAGIEADLNKGLDFIIEDVMHPYCGKPANRADLKASGVTTANVRYQGNRKVAVIRL